MKNNRIINGVIGLFIILAFVVAPIQAADVLKVGATPVPHAEILNIVKDNLAEQGIELEVIEFTDYVTPNLALADGSILANFFQHEPYLAQFNTDHNLDLVSVLKLHVEPYGLYSDKITKIEELADGATIALPNDPSNEGRALLLLQSKGLIKLADPTSLKATPLDIVENPKDLEFKELGAAQLPRILPDVTAAFINTNYALEAGLNPLEDALIIEGSDSPYANLVAVKKGNETDPRIEALKDALTSDEVKDFILQEYEGAVVPVF